MCRNKPKPNKTTYQRLKYENAIMRLELMRYRLYVIKRKLAKDKEFYGYNGGDWHKGLEVSQSYVLDEMSNLEACFNDCGDSSAEDRLNGLRLMIDAMFVCVNELIKDGG